MIVIKKNNNYQEFENEIHMNEKYMIRKKGRQLLLYKKEKDDLNFNSDIEIIEEQLLTKLDRNFKGENYIIELDKTVAVDFAKTPLIDKKRILFLSVFSIPIFIMMNKNRRRKINIC